LPRAGAGAADVAEFYKSKTIRIIVGSGRLGLRHQRAGVAAPFLLGMFGQSTVIVQTSRAPASLTMTNRSTTAGPSTAP